MKENDGPVRVIVCEILSSSVGGTRERTRRRLVSMDGVGVEEGEK